MPREIETYKTIILPFYFNQVVRLEQYINIEFIPDEIVLKYVSVNDQDGANSSYIHLLKTNLIEGGILFSIPGAADGASNTSYSESVDIPFRNLGKPVTGTFYFSLTQYDGTEPANKNTFSYYLTLTFLFIKFKSM